MKFSLMFLSLAVSASAFAKPKIAQIDPDAIPAGYIVISQKDHALYIKLSDGRTMQFPVATPQRKAGKYWVGINYVDHVAPSPEWTAPESVAKDHPELRGITFASGAPNNPMGVLAIVLKENEIAIHGTSNKMRGSVGTDASSGCVRMLNEDVVRLAPLVSPDEPVCMGTSVADAVRRCDEALNQNPRRYLGDRGQLR